jgi:endonuclease-3
VNADKRHECFARLAAANPEPETELHWHTPYQLLVAVILSAQATDKGVNRAVTPLFAEHPTPEAILALGEAGLCEYIRTIGLYRNKAKNVIATTRQLLELHDGQVPNRREALEALPGVGRKTANVILNIVFREPVIAVDTHIFRVANRTGLAKGRNVLEVEEQLAKRVPKQFRLHAHHWLILHGRYVCKARRPECSACQIRDLCDHGAKS